MRYVMLICSDESENPPTDDQSAIMAEYDKFGAEMGGRGVLQGGERLRPTSDATTVRVRDGEVVPGPGNGFVVPARRIRRDAGPTERVEQRVEIDVGAERGGRRHQRDVRHQGLPGSTIGAG